MLISVSPFQQIQQKTSPNPLQFWIKYFILFGLLCTLWLPVLGQTWLSGFFVQHWSIYMLSFVMGGTLLLFLLLLRANWLKERNNQRLSSLNEMLNMQARVFDRKVSQYQQIAENAPGGLAYFDTDFRLIFGNSSFKKWHNVLDKNFLTDLLSPQQQHMIRAGIPVNDIKGTLPKVVRMYSWIPDISSDGRLKGFFLLIQDISQLKQTEARLRQSNEELSQFAYAISHDLKEPLRLIHLFSQLLEKQLARPNEKQQESLQFLKKESNRMIEMLRELSHFSNLDSGIQPSEVDMASLIQDTIQEMALEIEESQTVVMIDEMPVIYAQKDQMAFVCRSLIANALHFRKADIAPIIRIHSLIDQHHWKWVFEDNGKGIPEKFLPQLFELFQRVEGIEPASGIRMNSCRKIIENHGGEIQVSSQPGKGSHFTICFPKQILVRQIEPVLEL